MDGNISSLAKSELVKTESANSDSWSNLQNEAHGFVKEHTTELLIAGALAATGIGLATVGRKFFAGASTEVTANAIDTHLSESITKGLYGTEQGTIVAPGAKALTELGAKGAAVGIGSKVLQQEGLSAAEIAAKAEHFPGLNRNGSALLDSFLNVAPAPGNNPFATIIKDLKGVEIPRFAEEYALKHPAIASEGLKMLLNRAPVAAGSEPVWAKALANIEEKGNFRTGEQLAKEFLADGVPKPGIHFAETMAGMKGPEIPRFTRELAVQVPQSATHNIKYILDRYNMPAELESTWSRAFSDLKRAGF